MNINIIEKKFNKQINSVFIDPGLIFIFSNLDQTVHYEYKINIYIHSDELLIPENTFKIIKLCEIYNILKIENIIILKKMK